MSDGDRLKLAAHDLRESQIARLNEVSAITGIAKSELVRRAIDAYEMQMQRLVAVSRPVEAEPLAEAA